MSDYSQWDARWGGTLEDAARNYEASAKEPGYTQSAHILQRHAFVAGARWQQAIIRSHPHVQEWREALSRDVPVEWRCSRCDVMRSVVLRFDDDGLQPATVEPPCAGYSECDRNGIGSIHEADENCPGPEFDPWCPFDAQDDYNHTGDVEGILAVWRDRKRIAALAPWEETTK
jgi:hypothetical protein